MAAPAKPGWVAMVDPLTGEARNVHPDDVQAALDQRWTVETPEQAKIRQYQQANGGSFTEGAKALGEHALSSATLGLSDVALSQLPGYNEQRQLRDETFRAPGMAGEALGFLAPGLGEVKALGTAGKAAKAIAAPVGMAAKASAKVGAAAERLIAGNAPGALRSIAAKGLGSAAAGAVEGGIIGAGQALSDASIHDKEFTAELLLSHVRDGAEIGGALGGGLGAGLETLSVAGRKLRGAPGISEVLGGSRGIEGLAQTKALTSFGALGSDIKRIIKEGGVDAPHRIGQRILDEAEFAGPGALGRAVKHDIDSAAEFASGRVQHYTDELRSVYRKLDEGGQRVEVSTVLADIDEKVLAPLRASKHGGDHGIARAIEGDLDPLISAARKADDVRVAGELVTELRGNVARLDEAIRAKAPTSRALLEGIEADAKAMRSQFESAGMREATRELDAITGNLRSAFHTVERGGLQGTRQAARLERAQAALEKLAQKANEAVATRGKATLSYDDIWKLRQRVDRDIKNWSAQALHDSPTAHAYRGLRDALKGQIEQQVSRTGLAKEFANANAGVSDWIRVEKIAKERSGSLAGNRSLGLTDTIMGAAGIGLGGVAGGAVSILGVLGNKFIRSPAGDRTMATMANSYANWRNVVQASDKSATQLAKQARSTVSATPVRVSSIGFSSRLSMQYDRQRDAIAERHRDQERMVAELSEQLGGIREVSPELADATIRAGSRGINYLAAILPDAPGYPDLKSLATKTADDVPDSDKMALLKVAKAVDKPRSILSEAKLGTLTPSQVDAVRDNYPALYSAIQTEVLDEVTRDAERGRIPDHQRRLELGILTGSPLDASARPDVIAAYQAIYDEAQAPHGQAQPGLSIASGKARKYASRRSSFTDREA